MTTAALRKGEVHPERYAEYLDGEYRHNYVVNILDVGFYQLAMRVVAAGVVLPAFVQRLGAPAVLIAFLPSIQFLCMAVPGLLTSYYIEKQIRMKPMLAVAGFTQRIPWLVVGLAIPFAAQEHPRLLLGLFLTMLAVSYLSIGATKPAWGELIAKAIPQFTRGRFMANITLLGSLMSVGGSLVVSYIMGADDLAWDTRYALLFSIASVLLFVSYYFFLLNREPLLHLQAPAGAGSLKAHLSDALAAFRNDRDFRCFIAGSILTHGYTISQAFLILYALDKLQATDAVTGQFVMATVVGSILASLLLGRVADRLGNRAVLIAGNAVFLAAVTLALLATERWMLLGAFVLSAANVVANSIGSSNIVYEFARDGKRPSFQGIANTATAPALLLYSLAGGLLAERLGTYAAPLVLSLVLVLAGTVLFMVMREPRRRNGAQGNL